MSFFVCETSALTHPSLICRDSTLTMKIKRRACILMGRPSPACTGIERWVVLHCLMVNSQYLIAEGLEYNILQASKSVLLHSLLFVILL